MPLSTRLCDSRDKTKEQWSSVTLIYFSLQYWGIEGGCIQKFSVAPHFVVVIPLALEWRTILFSVSYEDLHLLWHLTDVVLWTVQLHLLAVMLL